VAGYFEILERVENLPLDQLTGEDRMVKLWSLHPDTSPEIREPLPYLIDPPSQWARTVLFERFRRDLVRGIAADPAEPFLPLFLACVDRVLAWRATVAPADRYWETWPRRPSWS
jgi:hypothetical protein